MRIKNITLQNGYKRFHKTTINLGDNPKKIVVLTGPNGSGKSSVFDGMLYQQNRHSQIGSTGNKGWDFHSMHGNAAFESTAHQNVQIQFDKGDFSSVHNIKSSEGVPNTIFVFRGPHRHCSSLKVTQLSQIPDIKENNAGASSTIDLDDKITQNYQRLYGMIDQKNKTDPGGRGYEVIKNEIIGELNTALNNVLGVQISDHGNILEGNGTLLFTKTDQPRPFTFNVLSSGEKEVVDILLDFYLKKDIFNDSIYIIDEPELHINTSVQGKLLSEIVKLIPDTCQLWIATHSIGFLNTIKQDFSDISDIIWFEGKFGTEEIILQPINKTRSNWQKIFKTALEDLTGLLSPRIIIYCEGRPDPSPAGGEQGLDALIYNIVFEQTHPDILFISSGGNDLIQNSTLALKILEKAFSSASLFLLKDKDLLSDTARLTFLSSDTTHRMLNRREIENYIFDKDVLRMFCSAHGKTFDETRYDSKVTDINLQDLKPIQQDIQTSCGVSGSIVDFKQNLAKVISSDMSIYQSLERVIF